MPVILDSRAADDWMNPREPDTLSLKRLLVPAADDALVAQPASPLANSVKNDGPELLAHDVADRDDGKTLMMKSPEEGEKHKWALT